MKLLLALILLMFTFLRIYQWIRASATMKRAERSRRLIGINCFQKNVRLYPSSLTSVTVLNCFIKTKMNHYQYMIATSHILKQDTGLTLEHTHCSTAGYTDSRS